MNIDELHSTPDATLEQLQMAFKPVRTAHLVQREMREERRKERKREEEEKKEKEEEEEEEEEERRRTLPIFFARRLMKLCHN
jgi:ribosomal protein L12E/L44/L45/RPP1/RPP2